MEKRVIPLCRECASHELNEWINEKSPVIKPELSREIREEMRDMELKEGRCIVCNKEKVSAGWFERICKVINKHRIEDEFKCEFKVMFGFEESPNCKLRLNELIVQ